MALSHGLSADPDTCRAMFEASSLAAAQSEASTGRLTWVNAAFERLLGRTSEAVIGCEFRDFVHPDDRPPMPNDVASESSMRLIRPDGSTVWVMMNTTLVRDLKGRPSGMLAVVVDIGRFKDVAQTRTSNEQRLQLALHATRLGTWEWDLATARHELSAATCRILGFDGTARDFDADECRGRVHPDDVEALWQLDEAARQGRRFHAEYRIVKPDGSVAWVANHAWTLYGADGRPTRVIGTLAEVTARKQDEHDLRLVRADLEARVLERTDALAVANASLLNEVAERRAAELHAHELMSQLVNAEEDERRRLSREMHDTLGQHLTALAIGLKTVEQDAAMPAGLRARIVELQHAVGQLDDDIDRLAHELRPSALDDLGLTDALLRHAQNWSAQSGVPVEVLTDGVDDSRFSPAIETAVYRVVQEALTNVRKHASARHVGVILEHRAGEMRAIVEDDGAGFEPAAPGRLPPGASGLGLRGMSERAISCGGRLEVESRPGIGTTVYLTIPLRGASPTERLEEVS